MLLLNASANRDHRVFDGPDRFDVRREMGTTSRSGTASLLLGAALAPRGRGRARRAPLRFPDWEVDHERAVRGRTSTCAAGSPCRSTSEGAEWVTQPSSRPPGRRSARGSRERSRTSKHTNKATQLSHVVGAPGSTAHTYDDAVLGECATAAATSPAGRRSAGLVDIAGLAHNRHSRQTRGHHRRGRDHGRDGQRRDRRRRRIGLDLPDDHPAGARHRRLGAVVRTDPRSTPDAPAWT